MKIIKKILHVFNTRIGFFILLVALFWFKTVYAYYHVFYLIPASRMQHIILLINPLAAIIITLSLALYIKPAKLFYPFIIFIDFLNTVLLYINIVYFRGFLGFMTADTMTTGHSNLNGGLITSATALINKWDAFYWLDLVIVILLLLFRVIKIDRHPLKLRWSFLTTGIGFLFLILNLVLTHIDNPNLFAQSSTQSKQNDIVKYIGIDNYTVYDWTKSIQTNIARSTAKKSDLNDILKFTNSHYAAPNPAMYGSARGKNVIIIHLESFQQFLIDKKINGKEVTPFLNKIYHSQSTNSFDNFYHQVGQGRTADAENMLETSTYGLPEGSLFSQYGNSNTFQAAPAILKQQQNYTSAVFHGNDANFYNRNNTYKRLGFQYFFSSKDYNLKGDRTEGMGLKDKLLFQDSNKYLENLQQPFYAKYLTVTNHLPYVLDEKDQKQMRFKTANTDNPEVNNYFVTAHYLDQSVKEFYDYLHQTGLDKNSMIVIYGDHYGLMDQDERSLPLLGVKPNDWNSYYHSQIQRVPFMINMPGTTGGKIHHTYGGEIDVLPTILHLLGINSKPYVQFGTDLFSKQHDQVVAFRNRDWVSPQYTSANGTVYDNRTKRPLHPTKPQQEQINKNQRQVNTELELSDKLNKENLLRFYHPKGFKPVNPKDYNYNNEFNKEKQLEKQLGQKSTSLASLDKR